MGADYRKSTGRAPRTDYGPRKLVPVRTASSRERLYGKGETTPSNDNAVNDNVPDESLPRGWSILEPNRVKERRLAAGHKTTHSLSMAIGSISYQRLHKIESGTVVVRDSEYELIAKKLDLPVHLLQLPMLMHSETVKWMEIWGKDSLIEEGGDHDAVLLAAYVRLHARRRDVNKAQICKMAKVNSHAMHHIWHAAKPIDRYPDTTMMATMMLTENTSWDNVITDSRAYYTAGFLTEDVRAVQRPRVRYAPEDPDKRAPWTYDVDPFRARRPREQYVNAYTDPVVPDILPSKAKVIEERQRRIDMLIQNYKDAKLILKIAKEDEEPIATLLEYHPKYRKEILAIENEDLARATLHRMMCICYLEANPRAPATPFARTLGITVERVRQLRHKVRAEGLAGMILKQVQGLQAYDPEEPRWDDFGIDRVRRAA